MRELLAIVLGREGYEVVVAENGRMALDELERRPVDLLISDIHMPDMTGLDVLRTAKGMNPDLAGIMVTAFASTETAIEALRMGAYDYIHKPFNVDELKIVVHGALERRQLKRENVLLKRVLGERHQFSNIIGRSESMLAVFELIETIAQTSSTVLVTGESGTGKELAARAIHFNSARKRSAVRRRQLRRADRDAARVGAVRPRPRRLHRRGHQQEGPHRGRRARARSSSTRSAR